MTLLFYIFRDIVENKNTKYEMTMMMNAISDGVGNDIGQKNNLSTPLNIYYPDKSKSKNTECNPLFKPDATPII